MNPDFRPVFCAVTCATIACGLSALAVGQYAIDWHTVDGGGVANSSSSKFC